MKCKHILLMLLPLVISVSAFRQFPLGERNLNEIRPKDHLGNLMNHNILRRYPKLKSNDNQFPLMNNFPSKKFMYENNNEIEQSPNQRSQFGSYTKVGGLGQAMVDDFPEVINKLKKFPKNVGGHGGKSVQNSGNLNVVQSSTAKSSPLNVNLVDGIPEVGILAVKAEKKTANYPEIRILEKSTGENVDQDQSSPTPTPAKLIGSIKLDNIPPTGILEKPKDEEPYKYPEVGKLSNSTLKV